MAVQICSRCVYDSTILNIQFDNYGVCNYCHMHDRLIGEFPSGKEGEHILTVVAEKIKLQNKSKKYDCIVGISGGADSSFLLYTTVRLGLKPLAVHFDNGWNSPVSVSNMERITKALNVELAYWKVDSSKYDAIYASLLKAGVADLEIPTDIGLAGALSRFAARHNVRYVFEGHSFRTEGISPIGWGYMDGKYIESVHKQFGNKDLETFPNMSILDQLKWMIIDNIKRFRPLWYIDHNKEDTKQFLASEFGWEWYGGHHLESKITAFYMNYFLPTRWGIDKRKNGYSALIRSSQMQRSHALELLQEPPSLSEHILAEVKNRLGLTDSEFDTLMTLPKKTYRDYTTYKETFERLRPLFWLMCKLGYVPRSFYEKYCKKKDQQ